MPATESPTAPSEVEEKEEKKTFGMLINEARETPEKWQDIAKMRTDLMKAFDNLEQLVDLAPRAGIFTNSIPRGYRECKKAIAILDTLTSYAEAYPNARLADTAVDKVKTRELDFMGVVQRRVASDKTLQDKVIELLAERDLAEPLHAFWTEDGSSPWMLKRCLFMRKTTKMLLGGCGLVFSFTLRMEEACKKLGYPYPYVCEVDQDIPTDAHISLAYNNKEAGYPQVTFFYDKFRVLFIIFKTTEKGPQWDRMNMKNELEGTDLPDLLAGSAHFRELVGEHELFLIFEVGRHRHLEDPQDVLNSIARCFILMQILNKESCCFAMTSGFDWVFGLVSGDENGRKSFRTSKPIPISKKKYEKAEMVFNLFSAWFFVPNKELENMLETLPDVAEGSEVDDEEPDDSDFGFDSE